MSRINASLPETGTSQLLSNAIPDWVAALFLGRPMARALRFDRVEKLTRGRGDLIAPASWLTADGTPEPSKGKRMVDAYLPRDRLLKRIVRLPRTPRRMLARAVSLDMLRRTPFKTDQTYSILSDIKSDASGTELTQWVARRDEIGALRDRLAVAGLKTRRVLVADAPSVPLADFSAQVYPAGRVWRALNALALLIVLGALAWYWAEPALRAQDARRAQEAELQRLTEEALNLRQSIQAQSTEESERTAFLARMTRRTTMVTTLRAATVLLPDTVWVTEMAIDRNRTVIRGSAAGSAAQMLLDLPRNRQLLNPQLAGPVSRTADGRERFEIVFETTHGLSE